MKITLGFILFFFFSVANAQMQLNPAKSSLHFVSIKNNSVGEVLTFNKLVGSINEEGVAILEIDLTSINSQVEIRDDRMRASLFEVADFPVATITTQVDMEQLKSLGIGEVLYTELKASLNLHGEQSNVFASVQVFKGSDKALTVTTTYPIMVNARTFNLVEGIGTLRKLAGLNVISSVVPVSFSLVYE
jgi:polyisoprenoid-binding protein YceI